MVRKFLHRMAHEEVAAISSLYAIAILPLVVMAGVAFDYGRIMGLDTELQNAADQAALAAATQLDGSAGARGNAIRAAEGALGNQTRFANDGGGRGLTIVGDPEQPDDNDDDFEFYVGYEDDAPTAAATNDANARVVQVTVENRGVRYALTPVMAAFMGSAARGRAMATLQAATCNAPPLMFCQPNDPGTGDVDTTFPGEDDIGKGLMLHFKANQASCNGNNCPDDLDTTIWAPGNFGFLDPDYASIANNERNRSLGLNSDFLGCFAEPPETLTGFRTPQGSALNSRLDSYPPPKNQCQANGSFCPSTNTRKNVVVEVNGNTCPAGGGGGQGGGQGGGGQGGGSTKDFVELPSDLQNKDPGYPKDNCFTSGGCNVVGASNNDWGSSAWMTKIHGTTPLSAVPDLDGNGRITRYEVYKWEQAAPSSRLAPVHLGQSAITGKKYCSYPQPINGTGVAPSDDQTDRRILTVAAVDCSRTADDPDRPLHGKDRPHIVKWVDLFLVRTVEENGSERDFFTEIKGPARLAGDQSAFQALSRRKAVLLR